MLASGRQDLEQCPGHGSKHDVVDRATRAMSKGHHIGERRRHLVQPSTV